MKSVETLGLQALREIKLRCVEHPGEAVTLVCAPEVAEFLRTQKKESLDKISERFEVAVDMLEAPEYRREVFKLKSAAVTAPA